MGKIVCIGGAGIDRRVRSYDAVVLGTSNPAQMAVDVGGVAANVAQNLVRLGYEVTLASRIGFDLDGGAVIDDLMKRGVDVTHLSRSAGRSTASYHAVLQPDGEMVVAAASMGIFDEMTPEDVAPALEAPDVEAVFVDMNLSYDTLVSLRRLLPDDVLVAINPVSIPKAGRATAIIGSCDLFVGHEEEAAVISGSPEPDALHEMGVGFVVLTRGERGLVASNGTEQVEVEPLSFELRDTTGAGDAVMASVLDSVLSGRSVEATGRLAAAAAAIAVESDRTAPPGLSLQALRKRTGIQV